MSPKPVVLAVGILIIAQIVMFNFILSDDIKALDQGIAQLENQKRQMSSEKVALVQKFQQLKQVIAMIPPRLLSGFEDPETAFVEFLDYTESPALTAVGAKVGMRGQSFTRTPIPLHVSSFNFGYQFSTTQEAEEFINYLVFQEKYPVKVTEFSAKRNPSGQVVGEVGVALLIPAKLQLDLPASTEKAEGK